MKMSIGEKKILFVFGCPNREGSGCFWWLTWPRS